VIVAVPGMDMVQPAIDQPIDMIAVRHHFVAATGAVDMRARRHRRAAIGIGGRYRDHMFINMIAVDMMQMAIVQIIDMAVVQDHAVAAAGAVLVDVIVMVRAAHEKGSVVAGIARLAIPTAAAVSPATRPPAK
jgi:hypothetical protein